MNIGIICYASIGGSGIVATELGKMLAFRGHHVHVLSSDTPFRLGSNSKAVLAATFRIELKKALTKKLGKPATDNDLNLNPAFTGKPDWWRPPAPNRSTYFKMKRGESHREVLSYADGFAYYLVDRW